MADSALWSRPSDAERTKSQPIWGRVAGTTYGRFARVPVAGRSGAGELLCSALTKPLAGNVLGAHDVELDIDVAARCVRVRTDFLVRLSRQRRKLYLRETLIIDG